MTSSARQFIKAVTRLGSGEAASRVASFAFLAYISRRFGAEMLGCVVLAQTVATYVMVGTDQGLRLVGARVISKSPAAARTIIPIVFRKRLTTCVLSVALAVAYAAFGPIPPVSRVMVIGFVVPVIAYAFSLDWLAWGLNYLGTLGWWRGGVSIVFVFTAIVAIELGQHPQGSIIAANAFSTIAGAVVLWLIWRRIWSKHSQATPAAPEDLLRELRWSAVMPLGVATILTQMFHNIDALLLGAMATVTEVARYSAAYKVIFVILGGYWLITQTLYPKLVAYRGGESSQKKLWQAIALVAVVGLAISIILAAAARPVLLFIYGPKIEAVHLLQLLAFALPFDFIASLLAVVLASQDRDKDILKATGFASVINVAANFVLIPRMHATGAAWSTLIAYLVLAIMMIFFALTAHLFAFDNAAGSRRRDVITHAIATD
jgi:O-antigen/teichoic acid export membrane protein